MHIHLISIFPDIRTIFLQTSLIKKSQEKNLVQFSVVNPRDFCDDPHQKVDDTLYGGGAGLLLKAKPLIDAVESIITSVGTSHDSSSIQIIIPQPSTTVFHQTHAHALAKKDHLIFVCGRYEGIDHRFHEYIESKYPGMLRTISLGQFVTLGGETPSMVMIEAITRLIPGVIKEVDSWKDESYSIMHGMKTIEHPQYTKPDEVYGFKVPDVLLSGDHQKIQDWKANHTSSL